MRFKAFWFLVFGMVLEFAQCQMTSCGGDITSESGSFSYPDDMHMQFYGNNKDCWWNLMADDGNKLEVSITYMDIQQAEKCAADFLEIFDGGDDFASPVWKVCGSLTTPASLFKEPVVVAHFHSDDRVTGTGFTVDYRQIVGAQCGSTETYQIGTIESLDSDLDGYYDNNITCYWSIIKPDMANVTYQFYIAQMDIELTDDCYADYVELMESEPDRYIDRHCGKESPPLYTLDAKVLYVKFHSDSTISGRGFMAVYAMTGGSCGGILLANSTDVVGFIYPADLDQNGFYDNNLNCWWAVIAPQNWILEYGFADLDIENSDDCENDFLFIFDGSITNEALVGYLCGEMDRYGSFLTKTNVLFVQFFSDDQPLEEMYVGFIILYRPHNQKFNYTTTVAQRQTDPSERTTPNNNVRENSPTESKAHYEPKDPTEPYAHTEPEDGRNGGYKSTKDTTTVAQRQTDPGERTTPNNVRKNSPTESKAHTEPKYPTEPYAHTEPADGRNGGYKSSKDNRGTTETTGKSETPTPNSVETSVIFVTVEKAGPSSKFTTVDMSTQITTQSGGARTRSRETVILLLLLYFVQF